MSSTEFQSTAVLSEGGTASRAAAVQPLAEIGGYLLQERIGIGGFGEVWRGIGPGGFAKAVKILFGSMTGPQAETELKSLNRMRDLRHPFLLNVERVEVANGRVFVVTELADRSLEQRFKEVVSSGQRGIPRDELIGYLRDAADALDFMSEQHGLQHLDIKPENLLLQGSHAKVGDFGLTKNLSVTTGHSLVNGFTPLYAPPELFDGRPDRASDQYSLAIVYQVMMTGTPPFNGRSAAQLTSQHLKSSPDLSSLHSSDRAVVARALSKNPRTRFASCRQFIDELSKRRFATATGPRAHDSANASRISTLTELVESGSVGRTDSQLMPPVSPLRPVSTDDRPTILRPTVFVGLGGLGCKAVEVLQLRIQGLYPQSSLPALNFLCIDSDTQALSALTRRAATSANCGLKTVPVPLSTSHEYRKTSGDHLNWLSRRWLFNIPRSGNVEGMRPLGRLAIIDHLESVREALRAGLQNVFKAASVESTSTETGLPFSLDGLDVVLIGSTCGGTSSGSLLDVAWVLRSLMSEKRMPPSNLSAFLIHGTTHERQSADMQDANTISFLKELQYFCLPGVQRPGFTNRNATTESALPFDAAWLLHLGDELSPLEFQDSLIRIADYLELRTLTPARREMDTWHQLETRAKRDQHELSLRTFGLAKVSEDAWSMAHSEASHLCRAVADRWLNYAEDIEQQGMISLASTEVASLISDLALSSEGVVELVPRLLTGERTRRVDAYASDVWMRLTQDSGSDDPMNQVTSLVALDMSASPSERDSIATIVEEIRHDLASGLSRSLSRVEQHLQQTLDGRGRLAIAEQSIAVLVRSAEYAIVTGGGQKADLQQAFSDLCAAFAEQRAETTTVAPAALKSFCRQYCMLLICQTVCQCVSIHMNNLRDALVRLRHEKLEALRTRLASLSAMLGPREIRITPMPEQLLTAFDEYLLSGARFRLSQLQRQDVRPGDVSALASDAANFLLMTVGSGASRNETQGENGSSTQFPGNARPFLRNVGGGQRVMAVTPADVSPETWVAQLQSEFGQCVSVISMKRSDISVFCETEGIAISAVIDSLSHLKPRVVDLAGRVHSRQDIPW